MTQKNITLTTTPQLVAVGPGNAQFEGRDTYVDYLIGGIVSAPSAPAFRIGVMIREPMYLEDGEGLWLAGEGSATVYAQVDPS